MSNTRSNNMEARRARVLEPRLYEGSRDAEELENFLFDMEQYFHVVHVDKDSKVTMVTMYLAEDAKLWWPTKYVDIQANRCTINTWDDLKHELKN
ncbi:hypothetical protein CFOL_v3_18913 [Cephalotus follicularis]|uniref:Retrotransposon gag domain-containing protein n=1 Tax=Cephalotus follicularis TaxID=3775 RepID=A0A1Q3C5G8_CEPFO|nr:hypothetical protein CFOL_v3_18913 [Cephalotus follicularis]